MKKGYLIFLLLCLGALLLTGCGEERSATGGAAIEKKVVYTTFFPLYDFTTKIGGEKIEVVNIVPAGVEPHDWEPSPRLIGSLSEAEMLISNGLGMEPWLDKVSGSLPTSVVVVNASAGIEPLKGAKDHGYDKEKQDDYAAEEEKHNEMPDPHVWLDPLLALQQARNIATALSSLDPANATYYFNNLAVFQEQAEALDQAFQEGLSGLARREIIVTHLAFAYLAKRYNLEQVSISGLSPHIEPSPAQMKEIVAFGRKHDVRFVFDAPLSTSRLATVLAEEIGAEILVLNPLEGLTELEISAGDDYFSVMRRNLEQLKVALRE